MRFAKKKPALCVMSAEGGLMRCRRVITPPAGLAERGRNAQREGLSQNIRRWYRFRYAACLLVLQARNALKVFGPFSALIAVSMC
jgi:hypothetical protein